MPRAASGHAALSRLGSSPHEPAHCEPHPLEADALGSSPPAKKITGGLLKGLKRLGNLLTPAHSMPGPALDVALADGSRSPLAQSISTPELPTGGPPAVATSAPVNVGSFFDGSRGRTPAAGGSGSLRGGMSGDMSPSSHVEPHSPCSPFPSRAPQDFLFGRGSGSFASSSSTLPSVPDVRCSIRPIQAHQQPAPSSGSPHSSGQLPTIPASLKSSPYASSPVAVLSPLTSTLSPPTSSCSSGLGRRLAFERCASERCASDAAATAPAAAAGCYSSTSGSPAPETPPALHPVSVHAPHAQYASHSGPVVMPHAAGAAWAAHPVPQPPAQPQLQPTAPPSPTTLLAVSPALPAAMRRMVWTLEDYQVVKRLYKGNTSSVYKAMCLRSGLPVALKVYFLNRVPRNVIHMIKREIELHCPLDHPNVIQLFGAFLDEHRIVLVQEYAARGDLYHLLRQLGGRMTEVQVSELVMRPFLDAIAYLHSRGVCHRDVKPENILYTDKWVLKVADLGVSINLNEERAVTRAGTLDYMAPEVTRCPLKSTPQENKDDPTLAYGSAVDVWAAGVLAYELLVGFTPVVASQPERAAGLAAPPDSAQRFLATQATASALNFPASLSVPCRTFILAALSEEPTERPTAKELRQHPWVVSGGVSPSASSTCSTTP